MEEDQVLVMVKCGADTDVGEALRTVGDAIVNGRVKGSGVDVRGEGVYIVKDCGRYEVVTPLPFESDGMELDVGGRKVLEFEVQKKEVSK